MESTLYGSKDFGEEPSGRHRVYGDTIVNRAVMENLLKRHLNKDLREQREWRAMFEGRVWRVREKSKCEDSECGWTSKEATHLEQRIGECLRGMKRGNIQIDSYESLSVEGKLVSFCRSQSAWVCVILVSRNRWAFRRLAFSYWFCLMLVPLGTPSDHMF